MKVCKTAFMLVVLIRLSEAESRVKSGRVQSAAHVGKKRVFDCWERGQKGPECEQVICRHRTTLI